jgi:5-methylcytosine-specific restriction enzyme subunit McrC
MNIPILNIYYLLCYAWDMLEEKEIVDVKSQDMIHLVDLFTKALVNGTTYLFKKGLDRGYIDQEEESKRIRGKILFGPSLKRILFPQCIACCRFDEFSYDVLHNQILKATFRLLLHISDLDKTLKEDAACLYQRFPNVSDIHLDNKQFQRVKLNRNNLFYDFLIHICRVIYDSVLIDEQSGKAKFKDFVRDEMQMSGLFETFVRNFFKKEQGTFVVKRDYIRWHVNEAGEYDAFLPIMETDTSLIAKDGSQKIVIETKYKQSVLQSRMGGRDKVISENLYQLYAYLKNLEQLGGVNKACKGILLYAAPGEEIDLRFSLPNHDIRVKTLNLFQPWQGIYNDMLELISC